MIGRKFGGGARKTIKRSGGVRPGLEHMGESTMGLGEN